VVSEGPAPQQTEEDRGSPRSKTTKKIPSQPEKEDVFTESQTLQKGVRKPIDSNKAVGNSGNAPKQKENDVALKKQSIKKTILVQDSNEEVCTDLRYVPLMLLSI
jgi:hypothetical protein